MLAIHRAIFFGLVGLTTICSYANAADKKLTPVTFKTSTVPEGQWSPIAYGREQGYFTDEGIDLKILSGTGSSNAVKFVVDGTVRFSSADSNAVAKAIGDGLPVRVISNPFQQTAFAIVYFADSGIKKFKDLKGKKVGVSKGGSSQMLLPALLEANGMKPSDVTIVDVGPENRLKMMKDHEIDAIVWLATNAKALELQTGKPLGALPFTTNGLPVPGEVVFSDTRLTSPDEKDLNCRFLRALRKSFEKAKDHAKDSVAAMHKLFPETDNGNPEATLVAQQRGFEMIESRKSAHKPFGYNFNDDWKRLAEVHKKYGLSKGVASPDLYYVNEFAECAAK